MQCPAITRLVDICHLAVNLLLHVVSDLRVRSIYRHPCLADPFPFGVFAKVELGSDGEYQRSVVVDRSQGEPVARSEAALGLG